MVLVAAIFISELAGHGSSFRVILVLSIWLWPASLLLPGGMCFLFVAVRGGGFYLSKFQGTSLWINGKLSSLKEAF